MTLVSKRNENDQLRMMMVLLILKMLINLTGINRIIRLGIAFPLLITLACSHLLSGNNYYVYVIFVTTLIVTAFIGWCPITWLLKIIRSL